MSDATNSTSLTTIISKAIQIPGVKVVRDNFLQEQFNNVPPEKLQLILEKGPVEAGCSQEELLKKATRIIKERTLFSTGASFAAGIPGGITMAVTLPADLLQFYGVALRMAQELVYLYGEKDIWCNGTPDSDRVTNQLILYCGVMFGVSGASQAVRLMSSALANQALKKIPRIALTKTFYYPVIKSILKYFGISITKKTFATGVSKVIPVVGGIVSGGITFASMLPMGKRLAKTLDKAHFNYSKADFWADLNEVENMQDQESENADNPSQETTSEDITYNKIKKAKQLLDDGIITEEEFQKIKAQLLTQF